MKSAIATIFLLAGLPLAANASTFAGGPGDGPGYSFNKPGKPGKPGHPGNPGGHHGGGQHGGGSTPPVPEPETYGMLVAGLGLMAAVARRRRMGEK